MEPETEHGGRGGPFEELELTCNWAYKAETPLELTTEESDEEPEPEDGPEYQPEPAALNAMAISALTAACEAEDQALVFEHHAGVVEAVCAGAGEAFAAAGLAVRRVLPFGAAVAGLAVEVNCDVDLCVLVEPHEADRAAVAASAVGAANETHRAAARRRLEQATLQRAMLGLRGAECVLGARVPVIRLVAHWPGAAGTPVEVCVNRPGGPRSAALLRRLVALEPRFGQLVRLVTLWAKRRGLVSARLLTQLRGPGVPHLGPLGTPLRTPWILSK
jgi:hypothetical protein